MTQIRHLLFLKRLAIPHFTLPERPPREHGAVTSGFMFSRGG
jgi:hypothetical protein